MTRTERTCFWLIALALALGIVAALSSLASTATASCIQHHSAETCRNLLR